MVMPFLDGNTIKGEGRAAMATTIRTGDRGTLGRGCGCNVTPRRQPRPKAQPSLTSEATVRDMAGVKKASSRSAAVREGRNPLHLIQTTRYNPEVRQIPLQGFKI
jgi:hypothetical protein